MLKRAPMVTLLAASVVLGLLLLAGCSGGDPSADAASSRRSRGPTPHLGGPVPAHHEPPRGAMDRMERQVADRLSSQIAHQGLTLDYLDCAPWDAVVPRRMTCRGYVDGLVASVRVDLHANSGDRGVGFDARLTTGVIATRTLEETLAAKGWTDPACGAVAAYPARVGSAIVCRVTRAGRPRYVVATVTDPAGAVRIDDYRDAATDR